MSVMWLYILYALVAIGAAGVYGLLPDTARRSKRPTAILLLAVLAVLIVFGVQSTAWLGANDGYFCVFGSLALFGAVRVVTHARPVYSAIYFVVVVLSVAGLLVLMDAEFLAAALVIIYVGAILVTYIFVIMLAQQRGVAAYDVRAREPLAAVAVGFLLVASVGSLLAKPPPAAVEATPAMSAGDRAPENADASIGTPAGPGNVREIGRSLLTRYAVAVEVAGVLLLVAMVGAIWVARHPIPGRVGEAPGEPVSPPGQIGREAPPF